MNDGGTIGQPTVSAPRLQEILFADKPGNVALVSQTGCSHRPSVTFD